MAGRKPAQSKNRRRPAVGQQGPSPALEIFHMTAPSLTVTRDACLRVWFTAEFLVLTEAHRMVTLSDVHKDPHFLGEDRKSLEKVNTFSSVLGCFFFFF